MFPVADVIPSRTKPCVTWGLMAMIALTFAVQLFLGERLARFVFTLGLVPASFSWANLLSSLFVHVGWMHVLVNLLFLRIFGETIEDRLGHVPYLLFFLACGAGAALGHVVLDPHSTMPEIGASGAISGVLGAYFVLYPQSRVLMAVFVIVLLDLVEVPAVFFIGVWILAQAFSGLGSLDVQASTAFSSSLIGFALGAVVGIFCRSRAAVRWPEHRAWTARAPSSGS